MRREAPWYFCTGWWSPWCVVDKIAYDWLWFSMDKEHWFDRVHDQARVRWEKRHPYYSQFHDEA